MRKFLIAAVIATVSGSAFAQSTAEPVGLPTIVNYLPVMQVGPIVGPFGVTLMPRLNNVGLNDVPLGGGYGGGGGGGGGGLLGIGMGPGLATLLGAAIVGGIYSARRDKTCPGGGSGNC